MDKLLLVGLGGFVGSSGRYLVHLLLKRLSENWNFPLGILAVNVVGCFLIGLIAGDTNSRFLSSERSRVFVLLGVLGGFTTFSSFGLHTFEFLKHDQYVRALSNVLLNLVVSVLAVAGGFMAGSRWFNG